MDAIDWRHEVQPHFRRRAVERIMSDIKEYHEYVEDELLELEKFCQSFEQMAFASATSKMDYVQKLDSKRVGLQRQLQEEIHQKIKMFKEVYLRELIEMYQIIANRHQQVQMLKEVHLPELTAMFLRFASGVQQQDSLRQQAESDNHEALGFFKGIFETISSYIALFDWRGLSPFYRNELVAYEEKIVNFINANRHWKMYHVQPGEVPSHAILSLPQQQSQVTLVCSNENQRVSQCEFQEAYIKIQLLKEMYLPELKEMHQKISYKIWQIDNHAEPSNPRLSRLRRRLYVCERPKLLKIKEILERIIAFLQASKSDISPALKEELASITDQVITLINVNRSNARVHRQFCYDHKLYVPSVAGNLEEFMVNESDFD